MLLFLRGIFLLAAGRSAGYDGEKSAASFSPNRPFRIYYSGKLQ